MPTLFDAENDKVIDYNYQDYSFVLTADGVYGFWTVAFKKGGKIPEELSGKFTQLEVAREHVQAWVNAQALVTANKKNKVEV